MKTRRLGDLRACEVAERITDQAIFVLPVGAVEQHGDHLPLSTDLLIAESCAESVVAERGDELDLWLLPSLPYTKSNEHAWCSGTIWLGPQTMLALLDDIGRSIAGAPPPTLRCRRPRRIDIAPRPCNGLHPIEQY